MQRMDVRSNVTKVWRRIRIKTLAIIIERSLRRSKEWVAKAQARTVTKGVKRKKREGNGRTWVDKEGERMRVVR